MAFSSIFCSTAEAQAEYRPFSGYGELIPDPAGIVDLPPGFSYSIFSRQGVDKLDSGHLVPGNHDGMFAWLSCEETEDTPATADVTKRHGYVFEVDPYARQRDPEPVPLTALGRFPHEATATDPKTGVVYLTEDASEPFGLLYRFLPSQPLGGPGSLRAGGTLQAAYVAGTPDLSTVTTLFTRLQVAWLDVPEPDAAATPVREQFTDGTITRSQKLEGLFWARGNAYIVCSYASSDDGSPGEHVGQIWRYDPAAAVLELVLRLEPGGRFDCPDNITVSPDGQMVVCEDGEGESHLLTVAPDGVLYALARNALGSSEWCGATFSHDGKWLYANLYDDGLTVALTGPW